MRSSTAAEAWRIGLVHDIVEEEELVTRVGTMLGQLYSSGPRAVHAIKQLIPQSAHSLIGPGIIDATAQRIAEIRATPEAQEGLSAFLEKRKPQWTEPPKAKGAAAKAGKALIVIGTVAATMVPRRPAGR